MIRGVIFDLDGVLVFTDHYHYLAWKEIADGLGIPFSEEANHRLRGVSRAESLEILLQGYSGELQRENEKEELLERKNALYRAYLKSMTDRDVTRETRETLSVLRKEGFLLAVGSSSKNAAYILGRTQLTNAFDAVVDGNDIQNSKPDPEVFLKAAERLGLRPEECAVVEDADAGILAAKSCKMTAIGVGNHLQTPADYRIATVSELPGLLKIFERS